MYCPKCKKEYNNNVNNNYCPQCREKLIKKPSQDDINLNLSDKAAILGGLSITKTDLHNTTNLDQSVKSTTYVTNTVNKSADELHQEQIQQFLECCKNAFHNGLLVEEERIRLETERIRLGLSETEATQLIELARKSSGGRKTTLTASAITKLNNIDRYIESNDTIKLKTEISRLAALVRNSNIEEILFKYHMLLAAIKPKELIKNFEENTADEYWQTYWVAVAYMKYGDNINAEEAIVKLDLYPEYAEDNSLLLSTLSTYKDYGAEEAKNYISSVIPEQCSPLLLPFIQALFIEITPERTAEISIDKQNCRFYLDNLVNLESPEAKKEKAEKRKEKEEAIKKAVEEEKKRLKAEEEKRLKEEEEKEKIRKEEEEKEKEKIRREQEEKIHELEKIERELAKRREKEKQANEAYSLGNNYYFGNNGKIQSYSEAVKCFRKAADLGNVRAQRDLGYCYEFAKGVEKNLFEAVKWYRKAAEQGYAQAQNDLAICYQKGNGVTQSYTEAVKWYRKAAEQGYAAALNGLGYCYQKGYGVIQSYAEAIKLYRQSAEKGNTSGMYDLGYCYEFAIGVAKDITEALKWYRKAAEQGHEKSKKRIDEITLLQTQEAQRKAAEEAKQKIKKIVKYASYAIGCVIFAYILWWGFIEPNNGADKELAKTVKLYRKSAEKGDVVAQNNLANSYYSGKGVKKDLKEAVKWYGKAAAQGYAPAQNNLGSCYYSGKGVEKDKNKAIDWYRKAAEQGYAPAQNNLGNCYIANERKEAAKWYRKAAEQNNADAQGSLGYCYEAGLGVTKNYYEAVKWYKKSAQQGDAGSMYRLALCYETGKGVTKNKTEAMKWYKASAENGSSSAQYKLGLYYYTGNGVTKNTTEAVNWWRKAANQGHTTAKEKLKDLGY